MPRYRTIKAEMFARLPDEFRKRGRSGQGTGGRRNTAREAHSFLEGPAFDRAGVLFVTDVAYGRIFSVSPKGVFDLVLEYDGEPCGIKFAADGATWVTDHKRGLVKANFSEKTFTPFLSRRHSETFKGLNDLTIGKDGTLYFTDQGLSDLRDPSGRVYSLGIDGRLHAILENGPSPNGLALSPEGGTLYVAMTRANAIWRCPLMRDGSSVRIGAFINLSGGIGPDGIAVDQSGGVVVVHAGLGVVWVFDRRGEPVLRIETALGDLTTNIAFGGPKHDMLFITESQSGTILVAQVDTPGLRLLD